MTLPASPAPSAIIVIDLQTAMFDGKFFPPLHRADELVNNVRKVAAWARDTKQPVCFIRHDAEDGDPFAPGETGWPVWPALGQRQDEPTFSKTVRDAFTQPALLAWLEQHGTKKVILLGAQSDACVTGTTLGGLERGLDVTVVKDAHSTWDSDGKTADEIIAERNAFFAASGARLLTSDELAIVQA